jgi:L-lactate permease
MEATYCLPFMMREMKALTGGHPVAELMLMFSFAYMVEGASGFGTPVALGAPMLVNLGHPPVESVVILLIFNTFATVWGAVGTPIWFGYGGLGLTDDDLVEVSKKAAVCLAVSAFCLVPLALTILVPWKAVQANIFFVAGALLTCVGPSLGIAYAGSYEFPSLIGGMIGCLGTAVLIKCKVGLTALDDENLEELGRDVEHIASVSENSLVRKDPTSTSSLTEKTDTEVGAKRKLETAVSALSDGPDTTEVAVEKRTVATDAGGSSDENDERPIVDDSPIAANLNDTVDDHLGPRKSWREGYLQDIILRTAPIWAVVLILIITRVEQIGVKEYLTELEPYFSIHFGTYGTFRLSVSIVLQLRDILTYPNLNWKYELLYLPFLMPFVLVSCMTMFIFRKGAIHGPFAIAKVVASRLANPAIALLGALVLVQLMIRSGTAAPAFILGNVLADWFQEAFIIIAPLLGALGSFFSGSTTVSNLTFGDIDKIAAESIGLSVTSMLALQAVGGSAGNGICLNNIIAACAVVGLDIGEGKILMKTFKFVFASTTIATIVSLAFFFRF